MRFFLNLILSSTCAVSCFTHKKKEVFVDPVLGSSVAFVECQIFDKSGAIEGVFTINGNILSQGSNAALDSLGIRGVMQKPLSKGDANFREFDVMADVFAVESRVEASGCFGFTAYFYDFDDMKEKLCRYQAKVLVGKNSKDGMTAKDREIFEAKCAGPPQSLRYIQVYQSDSKDSDSSKKCDQQSVVAFEFNNAWKRNDVAGFIVDGPGERDRHSCIIHTKNIMKYQPGSVVKFKNKSYLVRSSKS